MRKAGRVLSLMGVALALPLHSGRAAPLRFPTVPHIEPRAHKPYQERLDARVSFTMIAVPGGTFLMGSPDRERDA